MSFKYKCVIDSLYSFKQFFKVYDDNTFEYWHPLVHEWFKYDRTFESFINNLESFRECTVINLTDADVFLEML